MLLHRTDPLVLVLGGKNIHLHGLGDTLLQKYTMNTISDTILDAENKIINEMGRDKGFSFSLYLYPCLTPIHIYTQRHQLCFYLDGRIIGLYPPFGPSKFFIFLQT